MDVKKLVRSDDGLQREAEGDTGAWPVHLEEGFLFPEVGGSIGEQFGEKFRNPILCVVSPKC